ncbi:uncharacterized protein LOC118240663 [Electrophorus electricus]|uniref:uncharacterized protein LOC118240663 n=1 Tax=Electrophorus electricus TaxID=8005 RepID=UPI0015CFC602|nr:uncharacterized protein LOC118240663 [Electrophorus electricus]
MLSRAEFQATAATRPMQPARTRRGAHGAQPARTRRGAHGGVLRGQPFSTLMSGLRVLLCLLLLARPGLCADAVSEDVGVHQLQRLVELLTVHECEVLLLTISRPEENVFKQLDRLSAENNQLGLPPRTRRSLELGKNINQDKVLSLYRHVDAYDKFVNDAASRLTRSPPEEDRHTETAQRSARKVRGLAWNDLDLVVKRHPVAPYERRVLDGAWPLLYGLLLGVGGAFVVGVLILLVTTHVSQRDRREPPLLYTRAKAGSRQHRRRNASSAEKVPSQPRDPRQAPGFECYCRMHKGACEVAERLGCLMKLTARSVWLQVAAMCLSEIDERNRDAETDANSGPGRPMPIGVTTATQSQ